MHLVPEQLNILDDSNMAQIATMERRCQEILAVDMPAAGDTCSAIMGYITGVSGDVFPYDNRIFASDWDAVENQVIDYFTTSDAIAQIYYQIHVTDSTKVPVFEMGSNAVGEAFEPD
jgi:hypothetical protein